MANGLLDAATAANKGTQRVTGGSFIKGSAGLLGFVISLTGSESGAEDVTQEIFIRIWAQFWT